MEKNEIKFIQIKNTQIILLKNTDNVHEKILNRDENQLLRVLVKGFLLKGILLRNSFNVPGGKPILMDSFCLFFSTF